MLSRFTFCIVALVMCYASFFFYPKWKHTGTEATISCDVSGYYWYLPSIFIYKDLKHQSFKDSIINKYKPSDTAFSQGAQCGNGNYVMKYSSGMAVMFSPFFFIAHELAGPFGYARDGFSLPYQFAIQFGGLLISIIGLWYFRKLLLLFYADKVVAIVLVLLVLGCNYLNYAAIDCGMAHCWLFTIYVFILLNTHYYYQAFKARYAVRVGLLIGLAMLTRPTDVLSCLIPLLWGMERINIDAIKNRLVLFARHYKSFLLAIVCAGGVYSIQLIYWKYVSGHWLYYSYQDQNLYFRSPNFINYTFSYRSGWLTYAPMLALAFAGILPFIKYGRNKVAIISFFIINYYVVCCWNIWWYGGRAMIQSYPVLFFMVAELVKVCLQRKIQLAVLAAISVILIYYNTWLICQYHRYGLIITDSMKKDYFWRVVGRWQVPEEAALLLDNPDLYEGKMNDPHLFFEDDFVNDTGSKYVLNAAGGKTLALNEQNKYSDIYKAAFTDKVQWIRAEATFHCALKEWEEWRMTQFIVQLENKGNKIKENMIRVHRLLSNGAVKKVAIDMKLPAGDHDKVNILFWNVGGDVIYIDSLKIWSFNE